jgi:predicted SAM-dependent methyltransferase
MIEDAKKVNLGCGKTLIKGFLNIDFYPHLEHGHLKVVDEKSQTRFLNWDLTKGLPLKDSSVEVAYHNHFLEHVPYGDGISIGF